MKELKVADWLTEIDNGLEFRRSYGLEDSWPELEAMFYSVAKSSKEAGPNLIAASGDAMVSQVSVPKARFLIRAKQPYGIATAKTLESVDNSLVDELKISRTVGRSALHAFLWGTGIIKIGYDSEFGFDRRLTLDDDQSYSMSQFSMKGDRIEFAPTKSGTPWVASCLPHDIIVPFGTIDIEDAPWIIHRVVRHVDDVKADKKYEHTRDLQPCMSMKDFVTSYTARIKTYRVGDSLYSTTRTGKAEYTELFEIHDRRTGKIYVIASGHSKFLRNDEDLLQIKGKLPFVELRFVPNARTFWTTPDSFYLKPYQAETADISRIASIQRRASVLKFLYHAGTIDEAEMLKLLSLDPAVGVKVQAGTPLNEAVLPFTAANNNQFLYGDAEYVRRNARESVGFSRNQLGEFEHSGRRTATEAMVVNDAANQRMSRRQLIVHGTYIDIIKQINNIIFEFWKTPRWTEVVGVEGAQWIEYTGDQLKGDYLYDVDFAPENTMNRDARKMEALNMYATLSQDPSVDQMKLRQYLTNAYNDPEFTGLFGAQGNASVSVPMSSMQGGRRNAAAPSQVQTSNAMPTM